MNETVNHANAPEPIGPYSQAVLVDGGVLYTSGQIGIDPETGELWKGLEDQTNQVLENIGAVLERVGMDFGDVIKTTCYLVNPQHFPVFNRIYSEYFETEPARSCVFVAGLPKNALVEVEVIAKKQPRQSGIERVLERPF